MCPFRGMNGVGLLAIGQFSLSASLRAVNLVLEKISVKFSVLVFELSKLEWVPHIIVLEILDGCLKAFEISVNKLSS